MRSGRDRDRLRVRRQANPRPFEGGNRKTGDASISSRRSKFFRSVRPSMTQYRPLFTAKVSSIHDVSTTDHTPTVSQLRRPSKFAARPFFILHTQLIIIPVGHLPDGRAVDAVHGLLTCQD